MRGAGPGGEPVSPRESWPAAIGRIYSSRSSIPGVYVHGDRGPAAIPERFPLVRGCRHINTRDFCCTLNPGPGSRSGEKNDRLSQKRVLSEATQKPRDFTSQYVIVRTQHAGTAVPSRLTSCKNGGIDEAA